MGSKSENLSISLKKKWQEPEYRAKMLNSLKKAHTQKGFLDKVSRIKKNYWSKEENRLNQKFKMEQAWENDTSKFHTEEYKQKIKEASVKYWFNRSVKRDETMRKILKRIFRSMEYKTKGWEKIYHNQE